MNPSSPDPLSALRDIHLPPDPSWWPPAPGWWLLALIGILLLGAIVWGMRRWYSSHRIRKHIRTEFSKLYARSEQGVETAELVRELSVLLRRIALRCFPRQDVAGLTGERWLTFLDRSGDTSEFSQGPGRCLIDSPYGGGSGTVDTRSVIENAEHWAQQVLRQANPQISQARDV